MTKGLIEGFAIVFEKVNCVFCPIVYETKNLIFDDLGSFCCGTPPFTVLDSYRTNTADPGFGLQLKCRTGHGYSLPIVNFRYVLKDSVKHFTFNSNIFQTKKRDKEVMKVF